MFNYLTPVLGPPVLTILPQKQFAKLNQQSINIDCVANGHPKPHIAWLFNGERILLNERLSIRQNGSISITDVRESDAGQYTCVAENIHGKVNTSAVLEVMGE